MKKTKIVATIGPASESEEVLEGMILNGANVFRLNFSHGTHEYHASNLAKIRAVSKKLGIRVGVLQDISGPKIRVLLLPEPFLLKRGDLLDFYKEKIDAEIVSSNHYKVSINYAEVLSMLKPEDNIYLCDGSIRVIVQENTKDYVRCEVQNEGTLNSNKGINFPNTRINIDVITEKDRKDIAWGIEHDVDFMAISFVQNAHDIETVRSILKGSGLRALIFAKIEKFDAVENIDEILAASDGIMVARGDLGIEVPYYEVPGIQKMLVKKANAAAKPVITATQMLLSLTHNKVATRAEISDVANAVLDGTDAVMLSEESAVGIDPANAIAVMAKTIADAEKLYPYNKFKLSCCDQTDTVARSTAQLAQDLVVDKIICLTTSGTSAIRLARFRPRARILAVSHDEKTQRLMCIIWGLACDFSIPKSDTLRDLMKNTLASCLAAGEVDESKTYLLTAGYPVGAKGSSNLIRILEREQIEFYTQSKWSEL